MRRRKWIFVILFVLMMILCKVTVGFMTSNPDLPNVIQNMPNRSLYGVLNMFEVLLGVAVVMLDWKICSKVAIAVLILSAVDSIGAIFVAHHLDAIPGLAIFLAGVVILALLSKQYGKRYWEANTDQLTGIANRRRFIQEVRDRISKEQPFYFVYMDMNGFKRINDELGHMSGDLILKKTVQYWNKIKQRDDFLARLSGDEFCLLIPEKNVGDIESYMKPFIYDIMDQKIETVDGDIYDMVGANAGIVRFPYDGISDEDLMRKADFAMMRAKKDVNSNHCLFDQQVEEKAMSIAKVEEMVKKGLDNEAFYMVYQPQFDVVTKRLRGFESLVRLRDENGNVVSPGIFIPVMEKTGAILKMDYYVLRMSLKQMLPLVKKQPDLKISVNISARHISDEEFAGNVGAILKEIGFPPSNLEIEITEYSFVHSQNDAIATLEKLKKMGVMIALDDFGTGYSSLSMVFKVPLDLIKIDKSMIDNIHTDEAVRNLVELIINIGESLNCEILSEGIEKQEQADVLRELECDYIQGYLWGKPLSFQEAEKLVG